MGRLYGWGDEVIYMILDVVPPNVLKWRLGKTKNTQFPLRILTFSKKTELAFEF